MVEAVPVEARYDLVLLVVGLVCERIDVRRQARRRGGIDACDMVVDAYRYAWSAHALAHPYALSSPSKRAAHTCFVLLLTGCFTKCTISGGPSSRKDGRLSVRISITECASSSYSLSARQHARGVFRTGRAPYSGTAVCTMLQVKDWR